jgi:hypothetical protein
MRAVDGSGETTRSQVRLQSRRRRRALGACRRSQMCPLRNRQRAATITLAAAGRRLELRIVGRAAVYRLPQATGMRCGCRDRQGRWSEQAHQQDDQNESGDQLTHEFLRLSRTKKVGAGSPLFLPTDDLEKSVQGIAETKCHKTVTSSQKLHLPVERSRLEILTPCRESWPTTSAFRQTRNASREKTQALCPQRHGR